MAVIAVEQHNGVRGGGPDGTRLDVNVPRQRGQARYVRRAEDGVDEARWWNTMYLYRTVRLSVQQNLRIT